MLRRLAAFAALALLAAAVPDAAHAQRDACRNMRGRMINDDGARTRIVVSDTDRCLDVTAVGKATFTDADDDVASIAPGGSLSVVEARGGATRELTLVERGGRIERAYRVNGAERPAAESAEWFAGIVLDLVRETGFGAEARVARIRSRGGVPAVLDEVGRVRSSHVRRLYLTHLQNAGGLSDADVRRVVVTAGERLSSDHDKATLLRAAVDERGGDRAVADAVVSAARTLGSDHDRSTVLQSLLGRGMPDDEIVGRVFDAARDMGSDHDRATVLLAAMERGAPGTSSRASFFRTVDAMGSDHDRQRVLASLSSRESLPGDALRAVLASAARLGSDHDKAAVLLAVASRPERLRDAQTRASFDAALRTIGSDHDYRRVARALER